MRINATTELRAAPNGRPIHLPTALRALRAVRFPHKLGLLERLYGRTLARNGVCRVVCANGVEWKLDLADATQRWIVFGDYEGPVFLDWIRSWMAPGGVVVDSGANIGQMMLYLAPLPRVRVIAFEPLPEAMRWLEECVGRYSDAWQVTLVEKGLSDRAGLVALQRSGPQSTMRSDWYASRRLETLSVEVDTLDNQLERMRVGHVRLWKLDVEGFEVEALRGAAKSLGQARVDAVAIEVCGPNLETVRSLLDQAGYGLFTVGSTRKLHPAPTIIEGTTNLLALSPRVDKGTAR